MSRCKCQCGCVDSIWLLAAFLVGCVVQAICIKFLMMLAASRG